MIVALIDLMLIHMLLVEIAIAAMGNFGAEASGHATDMDLADHDRIQVQVRTIFRKPLG